MRSTSLTVVLLLGAPATAQPDAGALFEKSVRPVLVEKCVSCHGPDKQKGGLRVDSRAALITGGDRGPAIVPGDPGKSLLLHALAHDGELRMPPKDKLPAPAVAAVAGWVKAGAPWPDSAPAAAPPKVAGPRPITAEEKAFWAFQPVRRPAVPRSTLPNPIDAFLLARLAEQGLAFAPPADRRLLLRRVTFDLTGLPPTPAETDAFLRDAATNAYERVVERLLASPAYGEKWGRRWLDVARYADSNGMDENLAYVNAWRYRDWVIRNLNADKPYDQFVREQVAGDLIPGGTDAERADRLTATGFLVVGPKMLAEDDPMKMRMDIIDEQLDTLGQAVLGLTLGCARCHDHKFDPIRADDYYALAGIFYSTKTMRNHSVVAAWNERPLGGAAGASALAAHEVLVKDAKAAVKAVERPSAAAAAGFVVVPAAARLRAALSSIEKARPPVDEAMAVEDAKGENLRVHLRGNHLTLGAEAPRRFPRVLGGDTAPPLGPDRSGRLELADWLTRPGNPLTARVMVNRLWAGHFGAGLVRTTDNFGRLGERPTHPELLDWLAAELVESGWSLKHMHRLMVASAAYRSGSQADPAAVQRDPENRLLSRFPRRRLDAEEVRDGMLAVAGLLDRTVGGSLLKATPRQYVTGTASRNFEDYAHPRRSVYLPVIRSATYDVLQTLDFPDPSVPAGQRASTTIPTQALLMLNGQLVDQAAEAFAKAVLAEPGDDAVRVREAYRRAYGRAPTSGELERVTAYLRQAEAAADPKLPAADRRVRVWRGLCRVLLAANEFVFVE